MIAKVHQQMFFGGLVMVSLVAGSAPVRGSEARQMASSQSAPAQNSSYRVSMVSRTARAVNYGHRTEDTKIDFAGTDLMPAAKGEAKVWPKKGSTRIQVEFENIQNPTTFANEYLTYVLWAISPEGRPVNLGEVVVGDNHRSKLDVTTDLQAFAMIVTAEPYYAVRQPSNLVVLENAIRSDTMGTTQPVEAKYELIEKGGYIPTGYKFDPVVLKAHLPMEFFEARNAVRIAESAGAAKYAASSYANAVRLMKQADDLATMKAINKKQLISVSREAVETAEDAREIAVKRMETERMEAERMSAANAEAAAKAQAADAMRARSEADRQAQEARESAQKAAAAQAQAEQATAAAQAESERNRAAAASSEQQLQQAVKDREELRARLLQQFNAILETRDTVRGLVVSLSDVLFDSGKYTLRPAAREKLAKISGILLAYPTLNIAVEGHTDSVGGDAYNQTLSENRASAVREYLVSQGVPSGSVTAKGFGKTQPVTSNDTPAGRQQNRRVELVVSGEVIGTVVVAPQR